MKFEKVQKEVDEEGRAVQVDEEQEDKCGEERKRWCQEGKLREKVNRKDIKGLLGTLIRESRFFFS